MSAQKITRREFINQTVSTSLGAALLGQHLFAKEASKKWFQKPATVVKVTHSQALAEDGTTNTTIVQQMIEKALCEFTQAKDGRDAWNHFVEPKDTIGIKINTLGLRHVAGTKYTLHFHAVTSAITEGLKKIAVKPSNMLIWDMRERHLQEAGFSPNTEASSAEIRCLSAQENDFDEKAYELGGRTTYVTKILTQDTSALISVPLAKTHRMSGVTGALKFHYGTINNPRDFHADNCCNPGIAEVNTLPPIREKTRVIIMDALYTVIEGGPTWNLPNLRRTNSILVATDPVALDCILLEMIEGFRKAENLEPITPVAKHIKLAADLGLGEYDRAKINLVEIKLG